MNTSKIESLRNAMATTTHIEWHEYEDHNSVLIAAMEDIRNEAKIAKKKDNIDWFITNMDVIADYRVVAGLITERMYQIDGSVSKAEEKLNKLTRRKQKLEDSMDYGDIEPLTKIEMRLLANFCHPDKGGSDEAMKIVNRLYNKSNAQRVEDLDSEIADAKTNLEATKTRYIKKCQPYINRIKKWEVK